MEKHYELKIDERLEDIYEKKIGQSETDYCESCKELARTFAQESETFSLEADECRSHSGAEHQPSTLMLAGS